MSCTLKAFKCASAFGTWSQSTHEIISLALSADVSSCEPDVKYNVDSFRRLKDASTSPNDPLLSSQWDVPDINVKQAWAAGFTGNSQVIQSYPLKIKIWLGLDCPGFKHER